jgi:hypothetical protein
VRNSYLVCLTALSVALGLACSSDCAEPPLECPYLGGLLSLTVTSHGAQQLTSVEATVSGSPLTCSLTRTGAVCFGEGEGQLHVEAPGFQPIDVVSTVTEVPGPRCGCPTLERNPSSVTLNPD